MTGRGRFGKYGDYKRKAKLREVRLARNKNKTLKQKSKATRFEQIKGNKNQSQP